jgi:hypothetical protein
MTGHQMLKGFQPWLASKIGGSNLSWLCLVLWFVEPVGHKDRCQVDPDMDPVAIETLFRLVEEFLGDTGDHDHDPEQ